MGTPQTRCREMHQSGRRGDHVGDALLAPGRVPLHFLDLFQRARAQRAVRRRAWRLHRDEPLLGGAEDHWIVAAPAMRIRVLDVLRAQQHAAALQQLDDRRIGLEDLRPSYSGSPLRRMPASSTLQCRSRPYFTPVLKSSAPCAGAVWTAPVPGVHGDVVAEHAQDRAIQERMREGGVFQLRARGTTPAPCGSPSAHLSTVCCASCFGDDVDPLAGIQRHILRIGLEGHRHRSGKRPRRRRPDDGRDFSCRQGGIDLRRIAGQR